MIERPLRVRDYRLLASLCRVRAILIGKTAEDLGAACGIPASKVRNFFAGATVLPAHALGPLLKELRLQMYVAPRDPRRRAA